MNMNYSNLTTMYESIFAQMYVLLVLFTIFAFYHENFFKPKLQQKKNPPEICILHGRIVSICSSIGVNRSAAGMSRSGAVDESCRHRRSIVRHRIDAGFSSFPSRFTPILPTS